MEEWRATWHPHYEVSNLGRVRSWAPIGRPDRAKVSSVGKIMKASPDSHGYPQVRFPGSPSHRVHQLVALAFIGPCPEGQEVRHKNDVRTDNCVSNLEYGTHRQNCQDAVTRKRLHMQKLTMEDAILIRELYASGNYTQKELAQRFGVLQPAISSLIIRLSWSHV